MKRALRVSMLLWISFAVLSTVNGVAFARFEKEVCAKPKFSGFKPAHRAEVEPESDFSFHAPASIALGSVEAMVKNIKVDLTVEDRNEFFIFKGKLPASLKDTFARITVKGKVKLGCKGKSGWLVKITDGAESSGIGD